MRLGLSPGSGKLYKILRRILPCTIDSRTGARVDRKVAATAPSCHLSKESRMRKILNRFRQNEEGAALVEYGLLVGLIAVICVAAVTLLGQDVSSAFSTIAAKLSAI